MKENLLRVRFTELYEVEGSFGQESVSPSGGIFPKHLICSYDIHTKTVVFPFGWIIVEGGGTNEDNWCHTHYDFYFTPYWHTLIQCGLVEKSDCVEIDYDPKDFEPDPKLVKMTLVIPRRNKSRMDKLIQQYLAAKTIVAERSRASRVIKTIFRMKKDHKEKTLLKHTYELVIQDPEWRIFVEQLYKQKLIPKEDRFAILVEENVFPKQLAYFNK